MELQRRARAARRWQRRGEMMTCQKYDNTTYIIETLEAMEKGEGIDLCRLANEFWLPRNFVVVTKEQWEATNKAAGYI
jgi:hypothetical protein